MKRLLFSFLIILYSHTLIGQTDTEFWFVAPEVSKNGGQRFDEPIVLRLTTLNAPSFITISMPAEPSFIPLHLSAGADTSVSVDLSPWLELLENKPANTILNKGILIKSNVPITAYYDVVSSYCNCNPELYSLKGTNALGTEFLLPGQTQFDNAPGYYPTPYNAFDIVATEDNTTVTISPAKDIVGHFEGQAFQIVLDKGQTWSGVATSQAVQYHLHGTEIISDKPIAVTVTDDLLTGIACGADLVGDQVVPVNMAGNEFIGVRGFMTNDGDRLFVLGVANNTNLYFDGSSAPIIINRGDVYNHLIQNNSTHLLSSSPVLVYQTSGYGCEFGSAVLPQIQCTGSESVSVFRSNDFQFGLLLSTEVGNETGFLVNGDSTIVVASDFSEVPGTNGHWLAARAVLSSAQVPVGTTCKVSNRNGLFHLGLISGGSDIGCGYGYFSNFHSLVLGADKSVCAGDTAILDAGPGMEPYFWSTGATTRTLVVTVPGKYWVLAGVGSCLLSDTINISFHPLPVLDFGPDTLAVCGTVTGLISAPSGYANYQWNVPGNSNVLEVTSPGNYFCQVTDSVGCTGSDSVYVTFGSFPANLGEPIDQSVDLQTGLVASYPFNGNANDVSGNGNDGTVNGATLTEDRFGNANSAYGFDGLNDDIDLPTLENLFNLNLNFSISYWFKPEVFNLPMCILNFEASTSSVLNRNAGIYTGLNHTDWGNGFIDFFVGSGSYPFNSSNTFVNYSQSFNNNWNHVICLRYNDTASIFLNGVIVAQNTNFHQLLNWNGNLYEHDFYSIGVQKGIINNTDTIQTDFYKGKIDDIRVYNRVLSDEEITCLYSGNCIGGLLSAELTNSSICENENTNIHIINSQPGISYQLRKEQANFGNDQVGNGDTLLFNLPYILSDKAFTIIATDTASGCSVLLDSVFRVNVVSTEAVIEANLSSEYAPSTAQLTSLSQGAASQTWFLNGQSISEEGQVQIELTEPGDYQIVLKIKGGQPYQCSDADTLLVSMLEKIDVILDFPSAFSPNGDGFNDLFVPVIEGITAYSVWVKDSWGKTVAEFDKSGQGWNGELPNGKDAPSASYYFHANAIDYTGAALEKSGVVYLIRDLIDLTPNPTADKVVVKMNGRLRGKKLLKVLHVSGNEVFKTSFNGETIELDVSKLTRAVYIIQISNGAEIVNLKLIRE